MRGKGLFSLLYLISPLVIIGILYHADPDRYSEKIFLAGMILGACAYSWLVLEIVLIARIRLWERYFGQDFLYRIHAIAGIICVILVIGHKVLEEHEVGETDVGSIGGMALIIFGMITLFAAFFFSNLLTSVIRHIIRFRRLMERNRFGRYETQVVIHNAVLAGVVVMFIHVMRTSNAEESIAVKAVY
ncbi:MAG TPA: hypothetical protein PKK43_01455, partial [Spirochaetota bacterium]|nr:hypothetical protein [Spirochaetota bacterium]